MTTYCQSRLYYRKLDVLNRGFSAYNSKQAVCLLPRLLPADIPAPHSMLIWFGGNDCCVPEAPQHVSLDDYELNLNSIIDHATVSDNYFCNQTGIHQTTSESINIFFPSQSIGMPTQRLILLTPPKYDHSAWAAHKAKDGVPESQVGRREELCGDYAGRCVKVASQRRTQLVDVHEAMKARDVS